MKRGNLINSEISYVISCLGHMDTLAVADAGLPVPDSSERIDLALSPGVPAFLDVLAAVLSEMEVEAVVLAEELRTVSPEMHERLLELLRETQKDRGRELDVAYVPHDDFKRGTAACKAIIRTGEFTPYANIILKSGVVF